MNRLFKIAVLVFGLFLSVQNVSAQSNKQISEARQLTKKLDRKLKMTPEKNDAVYNVYLKYVSKLASIERYSKGTDSYGDLIKRVEGSLVSRMKNVLTPAEFNVFKAKRRK